ncbi:MAG: SDR family oxidoreductase, partial [Alphaproteobacteria bacterium]|nr:SDR family oxidoreductase [Alphaproteobacteria bacterium]
AVVARFAAGGYRVVASDLPGRDVPGHDGVDATACDVSDEASVEAAVAFALDRHGRIDALVNNAGIVLVKPLEETTWDDYRRVVDVNVGGAFLLCKHVLPAMRRQGGGAWQPIAARPPSPDGVVVVHSRSHENSRRLAEYFQGKSVLERQVCGSALKFGVLAAGDADFYPRFGTTMEWDTCAGQAVLEAAGGHVFDLTGGPLRYGKPGLKNDGFLAWGATPAW